jgi:methanogenic corrinoid protein MtbC1
VAELNREAGAAIQLRHRALAERVVLRQYRIQDQVWNRLDAAGHEKSLRDAGYHLSYLADALLVSDLDLFADYVAWVRDLFAGLGFSHDVLPMTLRCTREALAEMLPPHLQNSACAYIDEGIRLLGAEPAARPAILHEGMPYYDLARRYLDALLGTDRRTACQMVVDAAADGVPIRDLYLHVFQPCLREIGQLWHAHEISVAREHYCTAAAQLAMSQLYPYIVRTPRNGRRLIATCVGDELHEVGIRMVADFFEMDGWDTVYLGANTPAEAILRGLAESRCDLLAVSTTITAHIHETADLITRVRLSKPGRGIKVIVGGYPFNVSPGLWRQVEADGYAHDANEATTVANRLLAGRDGDSDMKGLESRDRTEGGNGKPLMD